MLVNAHAHEAVNENVASRQHNGAQVPGTWPNRGAHLFSAIRKLGISMSIRPQGLTARGATRVRGTVLEMIRLKTIVAAALTALLAVTSIPQVHAARIFNVDTAMWEEAEDVAARNAGKRRGSPIKRQIVDYVSDLKPGTIVVETGERRLYFVLEDDKAIKYGIGVGRDGFTWSGSHRITRTAEWPGWTPPAAMRQRVPDLPAYMPGGPNNPLGARALYIGSTLYRIHGTSEPWTIGQAVSSGCIRMTNEDVIDLYERVRIGARVIVRH
jgi:lipoprotein-anchoring transpeptidase ErfK/SrfK